MTKIAVIADAHVANHKRWGGALIGGLNERGRLCVQTLRRAVEFAQTSGCDALFILGDLFHASKPTPPLVREVTDALDNPKDYIANGSRMRVVVILGNHDKQSEALNDHACATMRDIDASVVVVARPTLVPVGVDCDVWCVPYVPGDAKDWLTSGLAHLGRDNRKVRSHRLAFTHLGIFDDATPAYLKGAHDAVAVQHVRWLAELHKIDSFAAGNWHKPQHWDPRTQGEAYVMIPGTICPASFSDPVGAGLLWIFDSRAQAWSSRSIPGPRFETVNLARLREITQHAKADDGYVWYYRARVAREEYGAACALRDDLTANRHLEVEIDHEEDKLSVREAAKAANEAAVGDVARLAAVDLAEVQEPGTKEGVARRFEEYRKGAL